MFGSACLNLRIRMPITASRHSRDFITKITAYEKICSMPNSMTVLPTLLPRIVELMGPGLPQHRLLWSSHANVFLQLRVTLLGLSRLYKQWRRRLMLHKVIPGLLQRTLRDTSVAMAWLTPGALIFVAGFQWQWEHARGVMDAPRVGVHCLAKCPAAPIMDLRVVCLNAVKAESCTTITHGTGVPAASWLDTIVRKAAHPCTPWTNSGRGLVGMKTCVRPKVGRHRYCPEVRTDFKHWAVITTILEINPAVIHFVKTFSVTRLVVVGDRKTNHTEWETFASRYPNVAYLSPTAQSKLVFASVASIPWNHFGRKSIGFLYAMCGGAADIYDFDDDNHITIQTFGRLNSLKRLDVVTDHHFFNPYPFFNPQTSNGNTAFVWPRGAPPQFIWDKDTYKATTVVSKTSYDRIVVIQSLANHDPDVDAMYRMTRPLPLTFTRQNTMLVHPRKTFVPWNAQAVLIRSPAFFGMLLPITVPGRVSDIWRSYITTRLLWETGFSVGFVSPFVTQYRNPHSYQDDLVQEHDLYYKCDLMLEALAAWSSIGFETLDAAYLDLIETLVVKTLLGAADLKLARAWVQDLVRLGYVWPSITHRQQPFELHVAPIVDQRTHVAENENPSTAGEEDTRAALTSAPTTAPWNKTSRKRSTVHGLQTWGSPKQ
jgi:hypothetical protein